MKKLLFVSAIAFFAFTSANAQSSDASSIKGFKIGGGLNVDFPISGTLQKNPSIGNQTYPSTYSVGVGIDLLAQYGFSDNLAVTGDIGFTTLMVNKKFKDDVNKEMKSLSLIPIRVGLRYYPSSQFYLGAKVGVGIGTNAGQEYNASTGVVKTKSETLMAYSFGAGYMLSSKLDIGLNYDGYSKNTTRAGYTIGGVVFPSAKIKNTLGMIGVRLGYTFGN